MKRSIRVVAMLLAGCTTMEPKYARPEAAIPASWPVGDAYLKQSEAALPTVTYAQIFRDPRLQALIGQALANNQDLKLAAANIAAARAQYRIQRAALLPQINASAGATASNVTSAREVSVNVGVPSFELDLFGRIRSLTHAQLDRYFATESAARATRLALVGDIAIGWLTYAADASLLQIAQNTVSSGEKTVQLTQLRLDGGIAPKTDLLQAQQILETAQADEAQERTAVAQDVNALRLLVGAEISPSLLPANIDEAASNIAELPAGVSSEVLLRRPDVVEAEYQLRASNADIGAARAALFPRISLTGLLGFAANALANLFTGGAFAWSGGLGASYSIFQGGAGHANVRLSEAQRDAALATYQKSIQTAFREVADALARRGTIDDQLGAITRDEQSAAETYRLEQARYREGIDPFLSTLVSQRSYYAAQQLVVAIRFTAAANLATLYTTLGGDSLEPSTLAQR
ncbi:efflux transporter outer membrane subunit [Sphingomonas sp.]|uniref:efflux transporter outer membrane subunit n=1 Tax=Sphingomonas sp. TaxID=28214 RepID=UPI0038A7835A